MKNKSMFFLSLSAILFIIFIGFTLFVKFVDVGVIGPNESSVGFSGINGFFHNLFEANFTLYELTDWCSLFVAIIIGTIFTVVGAVQLFKRKSLVKVDKNILALGIFYVATLCVYLFFQFVVINTRPVLIDGKLEASYPSSTTVLAITFFLSVPYQLECYSNNKKLKTAMKIICIIYSLFLIAGRLVCGVHWFSDIIGGIIISATLICFYYGLVNLMNDKNKIIYKKTVEDK